MRDNRLFHATTFGFVVLLIAVLAWLTLPEAEDPCATSQADVSAAVLADEPGDQDALANRAIIMQGKCDKKAVEQ
jgi:hypothetical protein